MNALGQPVAFIPNPTLNDIGMSNPGYPPTIQLNPIVLSQLPAPMQLFWWGHECAHHALGHTIGVSADITREVQADCWAIQKGKEAGVITRRDIEGFGPYLANSLGSPWGHLPGPQRIATFLRCYDQGGGGTLPSSSGGGDSCQHARDGECDEPELCRPGTDSTDCRKSKPSKTGDSCEHARDGECDEPDLCAPGTDTSDCRGASSAPSMPQSSGPGAGGARGPPTSAVHRSASWGRTPIPARTAFPSWPASRASA
jgi:hypothetical protein